MPEKPAIPYSAMAEVEAYLVSPAIYGGGTVNLSTIQRWNMVRQDLIDAQED